MLAQSVSRRQAFKKETLFGVRRPGGALFKTLTEFPINHDYYRSVPYQPQSRRQPLRRKNAPGRYRSVRSSCFELWTFAFVSYHARKTKLAEQNYRCLSSRSASLSLRELQPIPAIRHRDSIMAFAGGWRPTSVTALYFGAHTGTHVDAPHAHCRRSPTANAGSQHADRQGAGDRTS